MQTNTLKTYAPKGRRDFIAAVTRRAALFGLSAERIAEAREEGELLVIDGQPHPRRIARQRARLAERIRAQGFEPVVEAAAYTWFNRLIAIRYMELHGFLDHSYRVLSHPAAAGATGALPEILEQAQHVELPGLDRERVIALKMDGTQDETLYRELLLAQCRALHQAMPFLFEPVDDETELLLPDRLLQTDSLIRALVSAIPEDDWQEIEIIGWLYQFYISEKKDQVIGKVVKSEDIPAATQLFTPNWIVKYMVQNSLGAQWLATYPDSPLKAQMDYYIEPAEQTPEVQAQLDAITPDSLDPEALTLMDPACGSGHILVEAYELFKAIYLERGYRLRDIPKLILEKNLYGLDIDPRAAQLAGFALMMKAREDDRRVLERGVTLNVMALEESGELRSEEVKRLGSEEGIAEAVDELVELFRDARTFGSLIQVPEGLAANLPLLKRLSDAISQDLFVSDTLKRLGLLVQQAEFLATRYDAIVANPPYMGNKHQCDEVKDFLRSEYPEFDKNLFCGFVKRNIRLTKAVGRASFMTPQVWMYQSTYSAVRETLLTEVTLTSLIQPEYNAFWDSAHVTICAYSVYRARISGSTASFIDLTLFYGAEAQRTKTLEAIRDPKCDWLYRCSPDRFAHIPNSPIAYWITKSTDLAFARHPPLEDVSEVRQGLATADDGRFLRSWFEVDYSRLSVARSERPKWYPFTKGGDFRRWYGNDLLVINWQNDGRELREFNRSVIRNPQFYGREAITWSLITSSAASFRYVPKGAVFGHKGPVVLPNQTDQLEQLLSYLNSTICAHLLRVSSPLLAFEVGSVSKVPVAQEGAKNPWVSRLLAITQADWNLVEASSGFRRHPLIDRDINDGNESGAQLSEAYASYRSTCSETTVRVQQWEQSNNQFWIEHFCLDDQVSAAVPIHEVTLWANPAYRYGGKITEEEQWICFRQDTIQELVSYVIGCIMGRYSLDEPGLIYAHSGNQGFDPSRYPSFPADEDGILPITDTDWFEDDAANRLVEFIAVAWDKAHLEDNLRFLAANLSPKRGEAPRDTLRRYLADKFFKDHLQTYKKRPIYWCFSSGKHKAFQCLVYLHRYHQGTLARMRMEYVVPLQSKMAARIDSLADDIEAASSGAQAKRLQKERDKLGKQLDELRRFDEQLRHHADQRITLDLDDGVKVNYGKFGDLLAEVKAVTGKSAD
ncbi:MULTISPECIES: BREX-1 system adenine-specific DNA-methyltransferase PglX [Thiorhodovibrio]|uniref:BREX-1 system adenine-specific DNA-methyltransferase PglX n=1 Tax=Thiorhodovibrio TaxID=61593 RepID=UPI00191168EF|nr:MULTISPECIES: BREX-1 system adenine-specific DNA-methyltransferase PglX [Thiorhodovibrio]MBK5969194.1 SAM-dependent methyltransferase [Thiorhodovibrio winogradskyi]WPL11185.1 Type I restriction-modification system methyltransferase subunit [Thiorhodovibrio litoralis]